VSNIITANICIVVYTKVAGFNEKNITFYFQVNIKILKDFCRI